MNKPGNASGEAEQIGLVVREGRPSMDHGAPTHRPHAMPDRPPRARRGAMAHPALRIGHGGRSAGGTRP